MRFSHFLKYNAVPEWQNHYMDYNELKNLIYTLQTDELKRNPNTEDPFDDLEKQSNNSSPKRKNFKDKLKKFSFTKKNNSSASNSNSYLNTLPHNDTIIELQDYDSPEKDQSDSNNTSSTKKNKISTKIHSLKKPKDSLFSSSRHSSISSNDDKSSIENTYDTFVNKLTDERNKVDDFYKRTELKLYEKFENLLLDLQKEHIINHHDSNILQTQDGNSNFSSELTIEDETSPYLKGNLNNSNDLKETAIIEEIHKSSKTPDIEALEHTSITELRSRTTIDYSEEDFDYEEDIEQYDDQENTALLNYNDFNSQFSKEIFIKTILLLIYTLICANLKSFIELNSIGFTKITKKADKVLLLTTRTDLIQSRVFYNDIYTFQWDTLDVLNNKISQLIEFYSIITNQSLNLENCKMELKSFLHDHIVWERSNTWKDMLGLLSQTNDEISKNEEEEARRLKLGLRYRDLPLPKPINMGKLGTINNIKIPLLFFTWKAAKIAFIILFTGLLLGIKTMNDRVEGRCLALVECCVFLWALEAIPLFTTAFLVPMLVVLFKVLKNADGTTMGAAAASAKTLSTMWSSTIMILIAGFTLGEALSQYEIANVLASWLLAGAGTKPSMVLLMSMAVVFFLSMWISNVASPVLTYSLLKPVLDDLDADTPFAKAIIMGIALAADVGGMASPISSPQNIISMQYLAPYGIGWGQFFAVALPVGILITLCAWGIMCTTFKINETKLKKFTPIRTVFTLKQYFIIFVTIGTIILWCVEKQIEGAFGASGQIAVLPIVLFFGTGLLTSHDLNTFPWSTVILAMGSVALGDAVSSSGLLKTIATSLQKRIEHDSVMAILCIFGVLMLVVGTFVSHTVSAIILIPLVQEIGDSLPDPKASPVLVFGCALLASCGMALPSSGFPNVTAISMIDKKGRRYLTMGEFLSRGVPTSLAGFVLVITVGYGIMTSILHGRTTPAT
ncbi:hypothetical protein TBLA_0C06010 [Henningerozyma blattae CBS 6284]|uniref:SPX domain-containing protein n=1 Tax=Henningerozyma blattae (strain ATCC 34711 / CBS 6284 / DSM 70876 / NBRC 10599 / NRRL Y-10934 / UCD 77-7) TaxID=1071380 RepID=I2H1Z6_HENB6|nr:hypothetical protein TBLA_0C06010 [Tetrapisispora blattae CBS 6284]CCH60398.1 hypothetical protein TBLA_0C06010 [Tetrapisispora blattae CBS 6284]